MCVRFGPLLQAALGCDNGRRLIDFLRENGSELPSLLEGVADRDDSFVRMEAVSDAIQARPSALCPLYVRSLSALCPLYVRSMSALCPLCPMPSVQARPASWFRRFLSAGRAISPLSNAAGWMWRPSAQHVQSQ